MFNPAQATLFVNCVIFRKIPLVVSTGMSDWEQVANIRGMLSGWEGGLAVLQCTSCYPTPPVCINLNVIDEYRAAFSDVVIGYSGNILSYFVSICIASLIAFIFSI